MRRYFVLALTCALVSGCAGAGGTHAISGPVGITTSSVAVVAMGPVPSDAGIGGVATGLAPVGGGGGDAVAACSDIPLHAGRDRLVVDRLGRVHPAGRIVGGQRSRTYASYGAEISSVERDVFRDESVYLKVQAVLWAADGNAARRNKIVALLNDLRAVASFQWDSVEQYRLVAGWAATNLAQAAAIVGYSDPGFRHFLVQVCYPILDWTGGPNWHASFADSKLAIAAYVGDAALWADAKAYFYRRIAQQIYHAITTEGRSIRC